MSINFSLNRERMFKEVAQCVALNRLDSLMSFCNSCSLNYEGHPFPECMKCKVWQGIRTVSTRKVTGVTRRATMDHLEGFGSMPERKVKLAAG
jgi:hypothetical protein